MAASPKSGEYENGKLWFERKGALVTVGLTGFAIEEIGDVQKIEMPSDGDDYTRGELLATIEGASGVIELVAPAAGVVKEINETLKDEPEQISDDPLEAGWIAKIEIEDPSELAETLEESGDEAEGVTARGDDDEDEDEDEEDDEDEDDDLDDDEDDDSDDSDDDDSDDDDDDDDADEDEEKDEDSDDEEKPKSRGRKKASNDDDE